MVLKFNGIKKLTLGTIQHIATLKIKVFKAWAKSSGEWNRLERLEINDDNREYSVTKPFHMLSFL